MAKSWLAELKVGDVAGVVRNHVAERGQVERRTPTGIIVVQVGGCAAHFNRDGRERGGDRYWSRYLVEWTTEHAKKLRQRGLAQKLGRVKWETVPLPVLEQIAALPEDPTP